MVGRKGREGKGGGRGRDWGRCHSLFSCEWSGGGLAERAGREGGRQRKKVGASLGPSVVGLIEG